MSPRAARRTQSKLDREAVIDAALRLADEEGIEAITFRRLAEQFGVTPMALYWHFADKEALLGALADRLWRRAADRLASAADAPELGDDGGWGRLRLTIEVLIDEMSDHPAVAELVPARTLHSEAGLAVTEQTLAFLAGQGFAPARAADLAWYVLSAAVMLVSTMIGADIPQEKARAEDMRRKRAVLASLPPDRYPHIIEAAAYLTDCESPEKHFSDGVDAIMAGVRAQAPEAAPAVGASRR